MKEKDINSLEHTTWRCQYHIVFAPKYRRMAIFGQIQTDIGKILRQLCQQKGVEIIEAYCFFSVYFSLTDALSAVNMFMESPLPISPLCSYTDFAKAYLEIENPNVSDYTRGSVNPNADTVISWNGSGNSKTFSYTYENGRVANEIASSNAKITLKIDPTQVSEVVLAL